MEYDKDFNKEKGPDEKVDIKDEERKAKRAEKDAERNAKKEMIDQRKLKNTLGNCRMCLSNNSILEEQILSNGKATLLLLPDVSNPNYFRSYQ
jgi:hypothetical protein